MTGGVGGGEGAGAIRVPGGSARGRRHGPTKFLKTLYDMLCAGGPRAQWEEETGDVCCLYVCVWLCMYVYGCVSVYLCVFLLVFASQSLGSRSMSDSDSDSGLDLGLGLRGKSTVRTRWGSSRFRINTGHDLGSNARGVVENAAAKPCIIILFHEYFRGGRKTPTVSFRTFDLCDEPLRFTICLFRENPFIRCRVLRTHTISLGVSRTV